MPTNYTQLITGTKKGERPTTKDMAGPVQVTLGSEWVKTPILISGDGDDDDDDKLMLMSKFRDGIEKNMYLDSNDHFSVSNFENLPCVSASRRVISPTLKSYKSTGRR
jgi:hypothetical protein